MDSTDSRSMIAVHYVAPKAKKSCYTVMIYGESILTTVTSDPEVVTEWIRADVSQKHAMIGFEIEFDFRTGRIGTIQLFIKRRCLVFQLPYDRDFPYSLAEFLGNPDNTLVSSHIGSKIGMLRASFVFNAMVQGRDFIYNAPFAVGIKKMEMRSLKPAETDWDKLPLQLSVQQVHYACLDAFLNLHIWQPLFTSDSFRIFLRTKLNSTSITPHVGRHGDNKFFYDADIMGHTIWITVTADFNAVKEWMDTTVPYVDLGFEIEFDDTTQRVGTLQLFSGNRCLIYQLYETSDCPLSLDKFLDNHAFGGGPDMKKKTQLLRHQLPFRSQLTTIMDISDVLSEDVHGWKKKVLQHIGLGDGEKNWSRTSNLSDKQVHYACLDVFLNIHLATSKGCPLEIKTKHGMDMDNATEISVLKLDIQELKETVHLLKTDLNRKEDQLNSAIKMRIAKENEAKDFEKCFNGVVQSKYKEVDTLNGTLKDLKTKFHIVEAELKENVSNLKSELVSKVAEVSGLLESCATREKDLELKGKELEKLKEELVSKEAEISGLVESCATREKDLELKGKEHEKLKEELVSKEAEISGLVESCATREKDLELKGKELEKLKEELVSKEAEISGLVESCATREKDLELKGKELEKLKENVLNLETERMELQAEARNVMIFNHVMGI